MVGIWAIERTPHLTRSLCAPPTNAMTHTYLYREISGRIRFKERDLHKNRLCDRAVLVLEVLAILLCSYEATLW